MCFNKVFITCVLLSVVCSAQSINISGTVSDSAGGTPLPDAEVMLQSSGIKDTTGADGRFALVGDVTPVGKAGMSPSGHSVPEISGHGAVSFQLSQPENIAFKVYSLQGKQVAMREGRLGKGRHTLSLPVSQPGMYFCRIAIGGATYRMKTFSMGEEEAVQSWPNKSLDDVPGLAKVGAFNDTLVVTRDGYFVQKVAVSDSVLADMTIEMSPLPSPWAPDSSYEFEFQEGMVKIMAAGHGFQMGSDSGGASEKPVHPVMFTKDFWMDTVEVTQKEFQDKMTAVYGWEMEPDWESRYGLGDNYPAYALNWYDAILYCNARTRAAGSTDTVYSYSSRTYWVGAGYILENVVSDLAKTGYRLPTEAEWEYACRAATPTEWDFYWGDAEKGNYAWYKENTSDGTAGSQEVGQLLPNNYRLYDMSGNIGEWVNDWYAAPYNSGLQVDPTGPEKKASTKVLRGGYWAYDAIQMRSAIRHNNRPTSYYNTFGLRTVRVVN